MIEALSRKELLHTLTQQILPRVGNAHAPLLLARPGVPFVAHRAPLLRNLHKLTSSETAAHWKEEGYNALRYPTLIWTLDGEADYRIGVTRRMAAQNKTLSPKYGYYVAAMPTESFLIVPPETPISDNSRAHWERAHPERAYSRLLWFRILPDGVTLHICTTKGESHTSTRALFVREPRLLSLAEFLLHELQNPAPQSDDLTQHYLMALLLHVVRALQKQRASAEEDFLRSSDGPALETFTTPLQRACEYMEAHASQKLSIEQIAAHAYVSRSHLNRLFRAELGVTPAHYLTQRRMALACSLLSTTTLPIKRIGVLCGYPRPEHFNRAFTSHFQSAPGAFRRQTRSASSHVRNPK